MTISHTGVILPHMTDEEQATLRVFVLAYAAMISMGVDASAEATFEKLTSHINSLLATRTQEIDRLQAQLARIRSAHGSAVEALQELNSDPTVAIFQIATHFQHMGNQVGVILNETSQESDT